MYKLHQCRSIDYSAAVILTLDLTTPKKFYVLRDRVRYVLSIQGVQYLVAIVSLAHLILPPPIGYTH